METAPYVIHIYKNSSEQFLLTMSSNFVLPGRRSNPFAKTCLAKAYAYSRSCNPRNIEHPWYGVRAISKTWVMALGSAGRQGTFAVVEGRRAVVEGRRAVVEGRRAGVVGGVLGLWEACWG
jgi:hypothetical protein